MKLSEFQNIPFSVFENLWAAQNEKTNQTEFYGQATDRTTITTYQVIFEGNAFEIKQLSTTEYDAFVASDAAQTEDSLFAENHSLAPLSFVCCTLSAKEINSAATIDDAIESLYLRYTFLSALSDDTAFFSKQQRDAIKKAVGAGVFLSFDKISKLSDTHIFVQYYVDTSLASSINLPYQKQYALLTGASPAPQVVTKYNHESLLDVASLLSLKARDNAPGNLIIDYGRTAEFRGIDDYVNYLSTLLSNKETPLNENGAAAALEFVEFAVNQSSRTEIHAKNNRLVIDSETVSFLAENAQYCAERMMHLMNTHQVSQPRKTRVIPVLFASGIDLTKPLRLVYQQGTAQAISGISGIRLMLDKTHSIYLSADDLLVLEQTCGTVCLEYTMTENGFSVVFTDDANQAISYLSAPVWFTIPAESAYSTVIATYPGGTDNWGGQFDEKNKTITFSTNYSGTYDMVENDITINDIENLPATTKEAIRFLVSKGIFSVDKYNRFRPNNLLRRYDFTKAMVKMFYAVNLDARCSFTDISEKNQYYRYIASAEEQKLAAGYADGTFRGNASMTKEQVLTLCGRILVEKRAYLHTENDASYLQFTDNDKISDWAIPYIAVATRCGLIANGGVFAPGDTVTKAEGAELLYRTFMLLYDVSPTEPEPEEISAPQNAFDTEFRIAICIFLTIVMLFAFYIVTKIYQKKQ